jgi:hypothetical protein
MNPQLQTLNHLHKKLVDNIPSNNIFRDKLLEKFNQIIKQAVFIDKMITEPDPMLSKLALDIRVNSAKDGMRKLTNDAEKDFKDHILCERSTLDKLRILKADLIPDENAKEIRTVFRGLNTADQTNFLNNALDEKDSKTLAAILSVPRCLSGLSKEKAKDYYEMSLNKCAPYQGNVYLMHAEDITKGVILCAEQIAS